MRAAIIFALALAVAAPARAALTAADTAKIVALVTGPYADLAPDEIVLLLRLRVSPYIIAETSADGTVTFWYERREGGEIVELQEVCTVRVGAAL